MMRSSKRIIALLLCVLMAVCLFGCGGEETPGGSDTTEAVPETISVTITVKTKESVLIDKAAITLRDREVWPTVLDALVQACGAYEIPCEITADKLSVNTINNLGQTEDGMFWEWTLNGKAPGEDGGRAGANKVKEGDAIVFSYINVNG